MSDNYLKMDEEYDYEQEEEYVYEDEDDNFQVDEETFTTDEMDDNDKSDQMTTGKLSHSYAHL